MTIFGTAALLLIYVVGVLGFLLAYDDVQQGDLGGALVSGFFGIINHLFILWAVLDIT